LHHAIWGQIDGLKRAEIHQGYLLVVCPVFWILTAAPTKGAVEKELRACIPHQAISCQVKVTCRIEFSNRVWIVGVRRQNDDNLLHKTNDIIYDIIYDIYDIIYDILNGPIYDIIFKLL
jgi:hypothetical protein